MTETQIGSEFIGYRIEGAIGRGGMGVVYRAYDLRLKRTVALKLVSPELTLDERFRERFARETELAMALEHPNVVPIHDAGNFDGRLYLAMRLVGGSDLRTLLRAEGALEPPRALAICRQVAAALDAAHARGLVHGDVKPSNVLLDDNEHVYLADFGLTRRLDEQPDGRVAGSPAYLAPEQLEGNPADERSDIYALGCVLFECLTGAPPFGGGSRLEVAWAHLEEEPPAPSKRRPGLPSKLDDVVARALAKDPEQRHPRATELVTAAERALGLRKAPRIGKPALVGAGAIVLALAAALAVVLATRSGSGSAGPPLAHGNTLVRIDPRTNTVERLIGVPTFPVAAVAYRRFVWIYSQTGVVSEVDSKTNHVVQSAHVPVQPVDLRVAAGPVLAADANGAWLVGADRGGHSLLELILPGGERREYPLPVRPEGVATGLRAVWVVGIGRNGDELLRLDPATGRITVQARFPAAAGVDGIAVAYRNIWLVSSATATLYRVDPRLGAVDHVALGRRAGPPEAVAGSIWVSLVNYSGKGDTAVVNPSTLAAGPFLGCCGIGGLDAPAFGSLWSYDAKDGTVQRWNPHTYQLRHLTHVTNPPFWNGSCMTWITAGGGAVWVTLEPATDYACD